MKISFIMKGFIDPRRPDIIRINFHNVKTVNEARKKREKMFSHFSGRESWWEQDDNDEKINHFSGSGPQPQYAPPKGDIVNLVFDVD